MIQWSVEEKGALPAVAVPRDRAVKGSRAAQLVSWTRENRAEVTEALHSYGAILFRGFDLAGADDFYTFAAAFCPRLIEYVGGNSPRTRVGNGVYTATEYPKGARISLHNEASYLRDMPKYILFYCDLPPEHDGQTPLGDSRRILKRIDPMIAARFAEKKVRYVNNLHDGFGVGRSWQDAFQTKEKAVVEQRLREDGYGYTWKPDGGLRTNIVAPAVVRHPITHEDVWISQAEQWHPSSLDQKTKAAILSVVGDSDLPHNAFFGDGCPISESDLANIRAAMAAEEKVFEWRKGDLLLCDNYLVAHGRQPFSGERRILVALG